MLSMLEFQTDETVVITGDVDFENVSASFITLFLVEVMTIRCY
jgi:hypothetical protein